MSTLHGELVRRANEGKASKLGYFRSSCGAESRSCIDARAYRSAAECEAIHALQRILDTLEIVAKHAHVARPLLPKCEWGGILHVRASDLNHVFPLTGLHSDRITQGCYRWY